MAIKYELKKYDEVISEILLLVQSHYQEISFLANSDYKFSPDLERYKILHDSGFLKIFCAYSDDTLIGYNIYTIYHHLHLKNSMCAMQDLFYVLPQFREHGIGENLILISENHFRDLKINFIIQCMSVKKDFSKMLLKNGYKTLDLTFIKEL